MAILVLGGAGYIGSQMVKELIEQNEEVVVVDNLSRGHRYAINQQAKFYEGDIRDTDFLSHVFVKENIEAVIHFCADSVVPESVVNPLKYFDNNVNGLIKLLEVMVQFNVKKLIFSSTAAVYGMPKTMPIKETDPTNPINPYGQSKLMMEQIMKWAEQAYGIKYVALRYFNVAGASLDGKLGEDHNPETHLIPIVLEAADGVRDKVQMFGNDYNTRDGYNVRDYVHVIDLAHAHYLSLNYLDNGGKSDVFNLGSKTGFTVKEIVEAAREITGQSIVAKDAPRRGGDPDELVADSTKAEKVLKWHPEHTNLETIISTAFEWTKNRQKK